MSDSESDNSRSDSEPEFESIIATRARRSNAGSRLRQLIDLEETNAGLTPSNEDDDNVNLLFQEDDEDDEFVESNDESNAEENNPDDDADDDGNDNNMKNKAKGRRKTNSKEESEVEEGDDDMDENLSDSDISASDDDESEGERELQRQERLNRRKKRKADSITPSLKKKQKSTTTVAKSVKKTEKVKQPKPSIFDSAPIAPTSRRHSSRSTTLKNSIETHEKIEKEFERRQTIVPVAKKEYVEKTLEERLEEAKITEQENILSLTRFYEQEVQKKKKHRDIANSKKLKLKRFIRFWSKGVYITPNDEIKEIREEQKRMAEEEERKNKRKLVYLRRKNAKLGIKGEVTLEMLQTKETSQPVNNTIIPPITQSETPISDNQPLENDKAENKETKTVTFNQDVKFSENGKDEEIRKLSVEPETNIQEEEMTPQSEISIDENHEEGEQKESEKDIEEKEPIYEGPPQLVVKNYIIFEEFDKVLTPENIKARLLGKQSLLAGTRRDPLCEPLCTIKKDETSNIDLQKIKDNRSESFKSLLKLPKFGEKVILEDNSDKSNENDEDIVRINTPAPVGIHLPDGQKKMCLISGQPAVYYDPATGVPYATVESFKVIKAIVEGEYQWLQLDNGGVNSRYAGGIGCYWTKKDQRPAKGVPEGF